MRLSAPEGIGHNVSTRVRQGRACLVQEDGDDVQTLLHFERQVIWYLVGHFNNLATFCFDVQWELHT
jgi:hypothetical protein